MEPLVRAAKTHRGGQPPVLSGRMFFEALVDLGRTGVPLRDMPGEFGEWDAVYNRWRRWVHSGAVRLFEEMTADPRFGEVRRGVAERRSAPDGRPRPQPRRVNDQGGRRGRGREHGRNHATRVRDGQGMQQWEPGPDRHPPCSLVRQFPWLCTDGKKGVRQVECRTGFGEDPYVRGVRPQDGLAGGVPLPNAVGHVPSTHSHSSHSAEPTWLERVSRVF